MSAQKDAQRQPDARCRQPSYEFEIEFPAAAIGRQTLPWIFRPQSFAEMIAPARTFGFVKELEGLHAMNLARGAILENTLALDETGVVNPGLMRFPDEFVRHKILDAIGDMALAGAPHPGPVPWRPLRPCHQQCPAAGAVCRSRAPFAGHGLKPFPQAREPCYKPLCAWTPAPEMA